MERKEKMFILSEIELNYKFMWNTEELLEEINRDRSEDWEEYTSSDWEEGWFEWCEGDIYNLKSVIY